LARQPVVIYRLDGTAGRIEPEVGGEGSAAAGEEAPASANKQRTFSDTQMQSLKTASTATSTPDSRALSADELELARLVVATLNIEDTRPEEIDPEAPLYGDGLGLDSIDILEMSLAISKAYGVQLRSDDPDNERIFRSLRSLAAHVQARRAK
jgi:acyl carrier protein